MKTANLTSNLSSRFVISNHFMQRWNERLPDDWDRFVWMLNHGYYYSMYKNSDGDENCLHYNETDGTWVCFVMCPPVLGIKTLVTVYTVDETINPNVVIHIQKAFIALQTYKENTLSLHFSVYSHKGSKVYRNIKTIKLEAEDFISMDEVTLDSHLEYVAESLLNDDRFIDILEKAYPKNKRVSHCWLTVFGKDIDLNVEPIAINN